MSTAASEQETTRDMNTESATSQLVPLGYNQFFEDARQQQQVEVEHLARVVAEHKGVYEIVGMMGKRRASVSGSDMQAATGRDDYPAVGDWVVVKDDTRETRLIAAILPRRTTLRKKYSNKDEAQLMVTNVDVAFVVESMNRDYSLSRFERYLVLAREGGITPVIILNKTDLMTETQLSEKEAELHKRFPNVKVLRSSVVADSGIQSIRDYIQPGVTYCFVGSSGVGKSSIISQLITQTIDTNEISASADRGIHTTTSRQMYFTDNGGIIIDNPGSREVGVVDFRASAREIFAKVQDVAAHCKYRNCSHTSEQGCAVSHAIKSGDLTASDFESYIKFQKEAQRVADNAKKRQIKQKKFARHSKSAKDELRTFNED